MKRGSAFLAVFILALVVIGSRGHVEHDFCFSATGSTGSGDSTAAQIELGKRLFYDPILSRDSSISCSSCHLPEYAFTDGLTTSIGIFSQVGTRNAPTLTNVKNRPYLLLDGVNPSLEAQTLVPIQEHKEFDFNILLVVDRLNRNKEYVELAQKGFGSEITPFVYTKSIATFERTLISDDSPYDRYMKGDELALSASQLRGKSLFFDKLYCAECHNGNDFTNDALTNNGLYEAYADSGRMRLTESEADRAIFKVPTLRNVEVTYPYMHNGSIKTLEEVIEHYMSGGKTHRNKGKAIAPFTLTDEEKTDLVNFLKSLTDRTFIENPAFR